MLTCKQVTEFLKSSDKKYHSIFSAELKAGRSYPISNRILCTGYGMCTAI